MDDIINDPEAIESSYAIYQSLDDNRHDLKMLTEKMKKTQQEKDKMYKDIMHEYMLQQQLLNEWTFDQL